MKMPKKRKNLSLMNCIECGAETSRNSPMQKYCPACSAVKSRERSKKYAHTTGKKKYEETRARWADAGQVLSDAERIELHQYEPRTPKLLWRKQVEIPFSWAGSKNHIWSNARGGSHVYMRSESSYMRSLLTAEMAKAAEGQRIVQNRLWIDFFVQKPKANGDAVNFVDMICDAAKDALLIDDRWFSIWSVDWQIAKREPKIFVGFGQEESIDVQACSSCGRLLTFEKFQRNRGTPHGIGRNCRECQATKKKSLKRDNSEFKASLLYAGGVFS